MSDEPISRDEIERRLHDLDNTLRNHYDEKLAESMNFIAETEKAMGDRFNETAERYSKNMKWLTTIIATVLVSYAGIAVTLDLASKESQVTTDAQQTQQIMQAWKAIESTAAVVEESSKNTTNHIDRVGSEIREVRKEANARIHELEKEQRQHERAEKH